MQGHPSSVYNGIRGICGLFIECFEPLLHIRPILDLYDSLIVAKLDDLYSSGYIIDYIGPIWLSASQTCVYLWVWSHHGL